MEFDPWLFWPLAIIGIIITGISKSGFAGGGGVVAVPLLAIVIPAELAASFVLPLLIVMDVRTISYYRKHVSWPLLFKLLPGALVGIVIGGFMLGKVPQTGLQLVLAALCFIFALWQPLIRKIRHFQQWGHGWGGLAGLTSTLIHAGGPPINVYLVTLQIPKLTMLATTAVFFGILNVVKIIPYSLADTWNSQALLYSVALIPVAWFGTYLGHAIQARIQEAQFLSLCKYLLLVSGFMLLIKSLF